MITPIKFIFSPVPILILLKAKMLELNFIPTAYFFDLFFREKIRTHQNVDHLRSVRQFPA